MKRPERDIEMKVERGMDEITLRKRVKGERSRTWPGSIDIERKGKERTQREAREPERDCGCTKN